MSFDLTNREKEIIELLAEGISVKNIANQLFISPFTVKHHMEHIYDKLYVNNKVKAVAKYMRHIGALYGEEKE